jgi:hypothetical protein
VAAGTNRGPHFVSAHLIVVTGMTFAREVATHEDLFGREAIDLDKPVRWKLQELSLGDAGDKVGLEHERPGHLEFLMRDEEEERVDGYAKSARLIWIVGAERLEQLFLDLVLGEQREVESARERFRDRRFAARGRSVDEDEDRRNQDRGSSERTRAASVLRLVQEFASRRRPAHRDRTVSPR